MREKTAQRARAENAPDLSREELRWEQVPELMGELQDLARRLLTRWPGMDSLQPTLLVNTALRRQRRVGQSWDEVTWENRQVFFSYVFHAMRQKLGEYRRHQGTRGYRAQRRVSVAEIELFDAWRNWVDDPDLVLALQRALEALQSSAPELARVVEYRFFSGLTWQEVAEMQGVSTATVRRHWARARVLMQTVMRDQLGTES